ncbi:MAG: FtsX-like permease family protein [Gemmatimonas sp.]|nr:FtsX-like permease family protein [Gemmatimonas sp.]
MALGAARGRVLRQVLSRGAVLTFSGIALGLIGGWAAVRLMTALLYGVSATDPLIFASVAVGIAAVAMGATLIPALRATRVDPIVAIREG